MLQKSLNSLLRLLSDLGLVIKGPGSGSHSFNLDLRLVVFKLRLIPPWRSLQTFQEMCRHR